MTAKMYSADGFTPRKTSFAIMKGRRYRLPSPPGIQSLVDAHELLDGFDEHGLGQRRHRHALGRIPEASRIGVGAEQVHAAVVTLVGLETFENLLRVVQDGGRRIEREVGAGFDPRAVPALRLIVVARQPCDR